jgi:uncharacterized protein (TIGR00255 family)
MTGHGDGSGQNDRLSVIAEVRSVNNRHLKVTVRCPESFLSLEANIDRLVRETISRGTLTIHLRIRQLAEESSYHLNSSVARQYWTQIRTLADEIGTTVPADLTSLLSLPGVVDEGELRAVEESDWPVLAEVLTQALKNLQEFRKTEGEFMAAELQSLCASIEKHAEVIAVRAPQVVRDYRDRLKSRISDLLSATSIIVDDKELIREVSLFADRCDITEELTRLRSHLQQYRTLLNAETSSGRKLEFLGQELFREINTIGSKANDIEISHRVVDMKASIEKMREIIQNVE